MNLRRGLTTERQKENNKDIVKISTKEYTQGQQLDLNYKVVCITGTIPGKTRTNVQKLLSKAYPKVLFTEQINKDTDYLLTGHGIGQRKLLVAKKWGIPMIESSMYFSKDLTI
jgi:NAD-dependent DNA ligase